MPIVPLAEKTDDELTNIINNHRRRGKLSEPYYLDAMAELARRKGQGLSFDKTLELIYEAAKQRRFLSYKQIADGSGVQWTKVHYSINPHLYDLVSYAHGKGWPLLSAIVVNQEHVSTGNMEPSTLKGFVTAARQLGYAFVDDEAFLRDQQHQVFEWGAREEPFAVSRMP